ncbi:hypothetical protein GGP96_003239 [Salinibacter ruber]|uniref:Uncharacterized protein n=1 Tax=Salinibacter ruber TaxID=146919 RepID=A0A9X2U3U0_9BACT|nr:hypothetical protein [Salinibacter ruber]MCS3866376.1 hypothetical protein [Salinibacter ruber]MCS4151696.1 hypothetical protein [Salinibacter ruber]MCS4178490.1 hypothetical protein [Salinibacter ruber]
MLTGLEDGRKPAGGRGNVLHPEAFLLEGPLPTMGDQGGGGRLGGTCRRDCEKRWETP